MDRISFFLSLGKKLNSLLDSAEVLEISTLYRWMETKQVFEGLQQYFGDKIGMVEFSHTDKMAMEDFFNWISSDCEPESLDINSNGLCLLIAYCFEGIKDILPL